MKRVTETNFHDPPECSLSVMCHGVRLVEDDNSEPCLGALGAACDSELRESLDLLPHRGDASLVGSIQLFHPLAPALSEELLHEGECHRGLAGPRRAIEHQVGKLARLQAVPQCRNNLLLLRHIIDLLWAVLLDPREALGGTLYGHCDESAGSNAK